MKNKSSRKRMSRRLPKQTSLKGQIIMTYKFPVHRDQLADDCKKLYEAKNKVRDNGTDSL